MNCIKSPFLNTLLAILAFVALVSFEPNKKVRNVSKRTSTTLGNKRFKLAPSASDYYIIVSKKDYELKVYDEEGWYATYPIVFGSKDLGDKMREGDRRTPTGSFKIIQKKTNKKWGLELLLDYPTTESFKRFKERKAKGLIPKNAKIGNGIAIHSTRKEEEWTIDNFYNWTDGCISVKYSEMQDLYDFIPAGTPITIEP